MAAATPLVPSPAQAGEGPEPLPRQWERVSHLSRGSGRGPLTSPAAVGEVGRRPGEGLYSSLAGIDSIAWPDASLCGAGLETTAGAVPTTTGTENVRTSVCTLVIIFAITLT